MDLMRWLGPKGVQVVAEHLGRAAGGAPVDATHDAPRPAAAPGQYDRAVDALNRLPRPLLALGAVGMFGFAMLDPEGFAARMAGLAAMPEPLWWLVGVVVSFHFGARETHYRRATVAEAAKTPPQSAPAAQPAPARTEAPVTAT